MSAQATTTPSTTPTPDRLAEYVARLRPPMLDHRATCSGPRTEAFSTAGDPPRGGTTLTTRCLNCDAACYVALTPPVPHQVQQVELAHDVADLPERQRETRAALASARRRAAR